MPRSKTFSIEAALDKVGELFQERGYAALAMQDIAAYLGVSRATIHVTFGSKHALFVKALRHYGASRAPGLSELRDARAPRAALLRVFELEIAGGDGKQQRNPCLVLNTMLELRDGNDPEIARLVKDAVQDLEERFRDAIERGQTAGEIAESVETEQAAHVLLGQFLGLYLLVGSGAGREPVLQAAGRQARALLPPPPAESG